MLVQDDYLIPQWQAPTTVRAFVTTRRISPPGPPMNSPHDQKFLKLRAQWLSSWGSQLQARWQWRVPPCWAIQVHGVEVIPASSPYGTQADAIWTDQADTPCTVFTADCLPVIFCNRRGTKVAAAHAGWRGLAGGVLENSVRALNEPIDQLMAWFGPAISQAHFEVGPEVREIFTVGNPRAADAFIPGQGGRWYADLYQLARQRLNAMGLMDIFGAESLCTFADKDLCYSYRRDGQASGRMLTAIWLTG